MLTIIIPTWLQPMISEVFENIILEILNQLKEINNLISSHQFGFRVHYTSVMEKSSGEKRKSATIFMNIAHMQWIHWSKLEHSYTKLKTNKGGAPKSCVLNPNLYLLICTIFRWWKSAMLLPPLIYRQYYRQENVYVDQQKQQLALLNKLLLSNVLVKPL